MSSSQITEQEFLCLAAVGLRLFGIRGASPEMTLGDLRRPLPSGDRERHLGPPDSVASDSLEQPPMLGFVRSASNAAMQRVWDRQVKLVWYYYAEQLFLSWRGRFRLIQSIPLSIAARCVLAVIESLYLSRLALDILFYMYTW
ncbi:hypothetical protein AURDEDRAFT_176054 [Auricularia subglabra TFB-10046 SS5]|uniref:Uncharacterized protein n=1 Tax=Auricularia subglabra (strain TFB-10046 / SS5) TaxID=717982 RepID=J0WS40_AURST|nr:hypothetical protein AURDEDRAFT_176054 [Auricularia subglabra TFB-10046 SS5]